MKILFVVSGIGYGDATREHANILALKKKYPKASIMIAGYDNSYDYFQKKYPTIKIRGYKLPGKSMKINVWSFGLRNLLLPAFWFLGTLKVRLQAFNFIPDIVVSDFEPIGISLARVLRKKCIVVFGFDPLLYKEYAKTHAVNYKMKIEAAYFERVYNEADLVLIPTFKKNPEKHLIYTYIDPVIRETPEQLPSELVLMKQLHLKKKPFVVMLGGSEFGTKLAVHINKIACAFPKESFLIFGGDLRLKFAKNVSYIKYTPDFLKYLKVSKGVITLAGQKTLTEALVFKKPILCFPIQDHIEQILNAYALQDFILVSHTSSLKGVHFALGEFIRDLDFYQKKIQKRTFHAHGSEEFVRLLELTLEK
ncbi:MAG: glycosyltransferase family protein [bacterium]|nr:glycosyltransferase family protein [bacterium]